MCTRAGSAYILRPQVLEWHSTHRWRVIKTKLESLYLWKTTVEIISMFMTGRQQHFLLWRFYWHLIGVICVTCSRLSSFTWNTAILNSLWWVISWNPQYFPLNKSVYTGSLLYCQENQFVKNNGIRCWKVEYFSSYQNFSKKPHHKKQTKKPKPMQKNQGHLDCLL